MKYTILCYGDSNTYGYIPASGGKRYDDSIRWPCLLQQKLGSEYTLIEEGCSGRTTDVDYPDEEWKNGKRGLLISLHSHKPIDLIILMLGTNDLKTMFHRTAETIAESSASLALEAISYLKEKQGYAPEILFLCPPTLGENVGESVFRDQFGHGSYEVSLHLSEAFAPQAEKNGFDYLDTTPFLFPSDKDGVHITPEGHALLAQKLIEIIPAIRGRK